MVNDTPANAPQPIEVDDIQGLVVSSFAHLECVAYSLLRVVDGPRACAWLAEQLPQITPATEKKEGWCFNIAFTLEGLAALGVDNESLATFPLAMQNGGMTSERRSRILGDRDLNAPTKWEWGGPDTPPVHVLLMIFGEDDAARDRQLAAFLPDASDGLEEVLTLKAGRQPDSREHFGFADGVGQPVIAGSGRESTQQKRTGHHTSIAAGEFILGYKNADDHYPLSPKLGATDVGKNGTYLVFRQLQQDVAGFWNAVHAEARAIWPDDSHGAERLASKMVGRWMSGAALVLHPDRDPDNGVPQRTTDNDFTYSESDAHGSRCPVGAHFRRSNPRDALGPDPATALVSARRHRLMRRGRSYGDRITDPVIDDGAKRGLHFLCLNADLERQFEFVQQTWLNNPGFAGLSGELDPMVGPSEDAGCPFSMQGEPMRTRAHGIRSHVTVVGGAYWFLPGLLALEMIARR